MSTIQRRRFVFNAVWLAALAIAPARYLISAEEPLYRDSSQPLAPFQVQVHHKQPMESVTDALDLTVVLYNPKSSGAAFTITSAHVVFPESLLFAKRCDKMNPYSPGTSGAGASTAKPSATGFRCTQSLISPDQPMDLNAVRPVIRLSAHLDKASFWDDPLACLAFRSKTQTIIVRVEYTERRGATSEPSEQIDESIEEEPQAPLLAIIAGGVSGVMLAFLFGKFRTLQTGRSDRQPTSFLARLRGLRGPLCTILYGIAATTIAIFLLKATVSGFPISIKVSDTLGGLVLGLFYLPVADAIAERIAGLPKSEPASPSPPPENPPNVTAAEVPGEEPAGSAARTLV